MKFSIRGLLLVAVIVGVTTGWFIDRLKLAKFEEENKQLRIQAGADAIELAAKSQTLERYLKMFIVSPNSSALAPSPNP